ncbi:MAG: hypothetical protein U0892_05800 [Pirellulales bacterium]
MQLDKTEIVVRERSTLELLDLSLLILRRHFVPLLISSALIGLPLMLLNIRITSWMVSEQALLQNDELESPYFAARCRHTMHIVALWFLEFPLASLPATLFIGNQIFFDRLGLIGVLRQLRPLAWRAIWVLGFLRLGFAGLFLELFVRRESSFEPFVELFLIVFLTCGIAMLRRSTNPFAPEVLGLESCKLRTKSTKDLSYGRRITGLHSPFYSENFGRFMCVSFVCTLLTIILLSALVNGMDLLNWLSAWQGWYDHLLLPLSLWLAGVYVTVYRFLCYLDARIRLEGWEVELQMKAERLRLISNRLDVVGESGGVAAT